MKKVETSARETAVREPLFHIEKRDSLPRWQAWLIRGGAILLALIVGGIFSAVLLKANPFDFFAMIIDGALGSERRIWNLLRETALLLGVALAVVPAFKMKFWNLGANGQVLMGCLATTACMFYLNGKIPSALLISLMLIAGILAGAVWAVIPAVFKAFFKTNESLFTLMMNYIAEGLVAYFLSVWVTSGTGVLNPIESAKVPKLGNDYLLTILVVALLTGLMYVYLRFSKHGYELSVVGESENTARYIGVNVKKVVIRTLILSGAICGLMGFLLSGVINGTVSTSMHDGRGFTAIMVAWLAKFNPLIMAGTALFIVFIDKGVVQASRYFRVTNDSFPDIITGIIFFFVIGCEFFINYKLKFRAKNKERRSGEPEKPLAVGDGEDGAPGDGEARSEERTAKEEAE